LNFEIRFFTEDIFRVKFAGKTATLKELTDDPVFPPPEARMLIGKAQDVKVELADNADELSIMSSTVEVRVHKNSFRLRAYRSNSQTPFWKQRLSDLFTSDIIPTSIVSHEGREATFEAFSLNPSEGIYGLGERFDGVGRRGRPVDFVNHDAIGTSNQRSYINVPFFWSTNGYGCFVNSVARTEWDMGMSEAGTVGFCTEEPFMDYFIIEGQTPKDLLRKYTNDLTGTSPLPPIWTFGLWLSRNSYQSWDIVDEVLEKAEKFDIPVDDVHLDTAWFKEDWNPDFLFSEERFPEPEKKMAALLEKGIHVSLWQYKYEHNYLLYLMLLTYILALFRQGKTIYYSVKQ
jgi:alpha-D-xyloside xylohydrolase